MDCKQIFKELVLMTRLNKKDWDQLDDLIGKMSFGGYYDLMEFLKMPIKDLFMVLGKGSEQLLKTLEDEQELDVLIHLLHKLIYKVIDEIKEVLKNCP